MNQRLLLKERNLMLRIASGGVLAVTALGCLFFAPFKLKVAALSLIYTALLYEWHGMNKHKPSSILSWLGHIYIVTGVFGIYMLLDQERVLSLLLILVWSNDIFAYATGRLLGGPKLWPSISPSKTWSGLGGGVTLGTATSVIFAYTLECAVPVWLIALLSLTSHGGDLIESACKRYYGVKDSSQLIPGHGGFLDRLDSLLAVSLVYTLFKAILG